MAGLIGTQHHTWVRCGGPGASLASVVHVSSATTTATATATTATATTREHTVSELIRIVAVIAIVAYVIGRQFKGEALRGKRVVLLPVVLTVIGAIDVSGVHHRAGAADIAILLAGAVISASIGMGLGASLRLQARDGFLWGQLPPKAGWLWIALVASRVVLTGVASGVHAHVAASTATILLMLGINRLGQAAVVLFRATSAGIPFAPEKDGSSYLSGLTGTGR
jgi:hypothetical protein